MVHNHWLVGFGSQEVTSISYGWSLWHGGCCQDRSSHPGGDCAYGSGAGAWSGPHGTVSGIRWDDARYDCKDCPERRQSRCVPALDCEPERRDHGKWSGPIDGQQPDANTGGGRGAVPKTVIRAEAGGYGASAAAVSGREHADHHEWPRRTSAATPGRTRCSR